MRLSVAEYRLCTKSAQIASGCLCGRVFLPQRRKDAKKILRKRGSAFAPLRETSSPHEVFVQSTEYQENADWSFQFHPISETASICTPDVRSCTRCPFRLPGPSRMPRCSNHPSRVSNTCTPGVDIDLRSALF